MFSLYSPDLVSAGEEYLMSRQIYRKFKNKQNARILRRAEEKLKLFDIPPWIFKRWKKRVDRKMAFYSPKSGIVTKKHSFKGRYFKRSEVIVEIVDLKELWLELDIYEQDFSPLKLGQKFSLEFTAFPGESMESSIDFISPFLNQKTRTLKVRGSLENKGGRLKPGMVFSAKINFSHPKRVLALPNQAILDTGKRKLVWLKSGEGSFVAKEVKTGFKSRDFSEITWGIDAGDLVVLEANFLLDAGTKFFHEYR